MNITDERRRRELLADLESAKNDTSQGETASIWRDSIPELIALVKACTTTGPDDAPKTSTTVPNGGAWEYCL